MEISAPEKPAAQHLSATSNAFRMAPFVGLDAAAAAPLRRALAKAAEKQGIRLSDTGEALVLKGYLSSFEDGGRTVLTYVWDVYDATGTRLTRIDGQQKLPRGAAGGPLALDDATAQAVAAKTAEALARWRPDAQG